MSLLSLSVTDLLDAFASSAPTPGGGSAAALAGAMGASLLAMVAGMPKTKNGTPEERAALDAAAAELERLRHQLARLVDEDTKAYDLVTAAFKLPKGTDEEKAARSKAIQNAMKAATEAPLETMRACAAVLRHAQTVREPGNPNASSDAAVGTALARAGLFGGHKNVEINLGSLKDEAYRSAVAEECASLQTRI
jgi:formiminotetrahydrofolate cyclodeaminase